MPHKLLGGFRLSFLRRSRKPFHPKSAVNRQRTKVFPLSPRLFLSSPSLLDAGLGFQGWRRRRTSTGQQNIPLFLLHGRKRCIRGFPFSVHNLQLSLQSRPRCSLGSNLLFGKERCLLLSGKNLSARRHHLILGTELSYLCGSWRLLGRISLQLQNEGMEHTLTPVDSPLSLEAHRYPDRLEPQRLERKRKSAALWGRLVGKTMDICAYALSL